MSAARGIVRTAGSQKVEHSCNAHVAVYRQCPRLNALGGHMSVEAHELMVDVWTRWQGQVVSGVFPLGRYLGCSEHSGVFLTKLGTRDHAEAAIKLFPADQGQEEIQIPRWNRVGGLAHPHLLPLLEWGGCQLDGLPY